MLKWNRLTCGIPRSANAVIKLIDSRRLSIKLIYTRPSYRVSWIHHVFKCRLSNLGNIQNSSGRQRVRKRERERATKRFLLVRRYFLFWHYVIFIQPSWYQIWLAISHLTLPTHQCLEQIMVIKQTGFWNATYLGDTCHIISSKYSRKTIN